MAWQQPVHIGIDRARGIIAKSDNQEIPDPDPVERLPGKARCLDQIAQRIGHPPRAVLLQMGQRADAQPVTRAKQLAVLLIPQRKSKIAVEVLKAVLTPRRIGQQAQVGIARRWIERREARRQLGSQFAAPIKPDPADDLEARRAKLQAGRLRQRRQRLQGDRCLAAGRKAGHKRHYRNSRAPGAPAVGHWASTL